MTLLTIARTELHCRLRCEPLQVPLAVALVATGLVAVVSVSLVNTLVKSHLPSFGPSAISSYSASGASEAIATYKGGFVFLALGLLLITLAAAIAPLAGCATLNRERDPDGFDHLLATGVTALTILAAKLLAALTRSLLVIGAATPFLAVAWLFEGADGLSIAVAALAIVSLGVAGAALGIVMAAALRANIAALLGSYMFIATALLLGPACFVWAWAGGPAQLASLLYASPLALLAAGNRDLLSAFVDLVPFGLQDTVSWPSGTWLGTPIDYALSMGMAAGYLAIALLLLLLATVLLDPLHPWRNLFWRGGRG